MEIREQFCKKHGNTAHYVQVRKISDFTHRRKSKVNGTGRCKKCNVERILKHRRDRKIFLVEYAGGKCCKCGYNKNVKALEFHHVDPETKEYTLGQGGVCRDLERDKKEVDKCVLLCSNCHKEEHDV